ncbi:hypothetical protein Tco_0188749, partial [Tanacetum coccineum]
DIPVTAIAEPSFFAPTNRPPTLTPLFTQLQQTPILTPATTLSSSLQNLPDFGSLFGFDYRLKALEANFSEFKQTNQYAEAFSSIPGIVDQYLANKMKEAVDVAVQLKSDRIQEEAQAENQQFLDSIDEGMKKIIKEQVKNEVSKITPKTEKSDIQRQLYKALVDAYEADKILLDTYGDTVTIKRPRDGADDDQEPSAGTDRGSKRRRSGKEPESTSASREKITTTAGKTTTGSKTHKQSASQSAPVEETMQSTDVFEAPAHQEFETVLLEENSSYCSRLQLPVLNQSVNTARITAVGEKVNAAESLLVVSTKVNANLTEVNADYTANNLVLLTCLEVKKEKAGTFDTALEVILDGLESDMLLLLRTWAGCWVELCKQIILILPVMVVSTVKKGAAGGGHHCSKCKVKVVVLVALCY